MNQFKYLTKTIHCCKVMNIHVVILIQMALEKKQGVSNLELMYEELLEEERAKEQRREQKRQKRKKKKAKSSQIAEKENIAVQNDNEPTKCEVSVKI